MGLEKVTSRVREGFDFRAVEGAIREDFDKADRSAIKWDINFKVNQLHKRKVKGSDGGAKVKAKVGAVLKRPVPSVFLIEKLLSAEVKLAAQFGVLGGREVRVGEAIRAGGEEGVEVHRE